MKRRPKIEVYADEAGEWRWRVRAGNGRILADSGEGYRRRRDCVAGLRLLFAALDRLVDDDA